jgi:para-nitrobenzyl esterase
MHRSLPLLASLTVSLGVAAVADPVRTAGGLVSGASGADPTVRVYKGIPYAAPPVGALRWKAPQAAAVWKGVRAGTEFSAPCMQEPYAQTSIYYTPLPNVSEDCLYLNVWTAAASAGEKRPVMVWIHGGAYTRGSGETPTYNGEVLAPKGAVVVTINYRLGIFGFLAHPELTKESDVKSSGNYGLLDMVAALEWVKKNIAAFGGDPGRVTIFGESAGSSAVNFLMASPLAKGLFHRVIGESGANFGGANFGRRSVLADAEKAGAQLGTLTELRAKSAVDLLKVQISTRPTVDGWFLPQEVSAIFGQGKQSDVPVIAGYNADEMTTLAPLPAGANAKTFLDLVHNRYAKVADEFLKLYPAGSDAEAANSYYASARDGGMGFQMRTWARMQTKSGKAPAYLYYFSRIPPGPTAAKFRSYHAAEIQYAFGNLRGNRPWEDADRKLSDVMSSYWVNFAAKGDPNGKGLPKWPVYDAQADVSMEFGDAPAAKASVNKAGIDFFESLYAAQRAQ